MSAPKTCAHCAEQSTHSVLGAEGPAVELCDLHLDLELDAAPSVQPTCCPLHDEAPDSPITEKSAECQLMHAWGIGDGEWLNDGTGTPEEAARRAGWEVLHRLEEHPGAILARPATSTALYVVADLGGPRAVRVAS